MGFLDKAKEKAQELAGQAKDKYEDVQGHRKADDLLGELGRITFLDRTGRTVPGADAEIARLVEEIKALEAEGIDIEAKPEPAPLPPPGTADGAPTPTETAPTNTAPAAPLPTASPQVTAPLPANSDVIPSAGLPTPPTPDA